MQIHSNKQENYSVNVAKMIELYETNSAVRQLYRRQECHYSTQVRSMLIQFSSITASMLQSLSFMKHI